MALEATTASRTNGTGPTTESQLADLIALLKERLQTDAVAETVYGPSRVVGERTLIPVARVVYGFGIGAGGGPTTMGANVGGSGLGAGVQAIPIAVVEITPGGTRVIPIVDVGRIAARAFVFAGCMTIAGLLLGRRSTRAGSERTPRLAWLRFWRHPR
jgi:uncharacterized spore protein YtfJ